MASYHRYSGKEGRLVPFEKGNILGYGRLPSRIPNMAPEQAAYLGGLIDGDGSIWHSRRSKRGGWYVSVGNNDPELISACLRFSQAGSVGATIKRDKVHMIWMLGRQEEVLDFVHQILPYSAKAHDLIRRLKSDIPRP